MKNTAAVTTNEPEWTDEQYAERKRHMEEAIEIPLMGSRPGLGYVGSREHIADFMADTLYEHRKMMERIKADIFLGYYEDDK